MKDFNKYVSAYKEQLDKGSIQKAYSGLVKYVMKLNIVFKRNLSGKFSVENILQGYMDYTYFYFYNEFLKKNKLKLALVLNHQNVRFEICLLGQTIEVQKKYWELLKTCEWNKDKTEMPQYYVLESVLDENPDFSNLDLLTAQIEKRTVQISDELMILLKTINREKRGEQESLRTTSDYEIRGLSPQPVQIADTLGTIKIDKNAKDYYFNFYPDPGTVLQCSRKQINSI